MNRLWRIPAVEKERTPCQQETLELLDHFINYACETLEKKGYTIIEMRSISSNQWIIERIFVGKIDNSTKRYLEDRYGQAK